MRNTFFLSMLLTVMILASRASAQTTAPSNAATAPYAPHDLPGIGLAQHPFMYAGEAQPLNLYIIRDGKIAWSYTHPGKGEISDAAMLSNGDILFAYQFGAAEVSPDKKIVWSHEAPAGTEIHTAVPMGLDRIAYVINGDPAKLVVTNKTTGATEKEFTLATANPKQVHGHFRHVRVTPAGTFLIGHMDMNKVCEYSAEGKEIWTYAIPSPWSAARLKNGNTLIATNRNIVREVNPAGETVWELTQKDIPEYRLMGTQTVNRLANGNTIINSWGAPRGDNQPVQFLEVTPEKKVVWAVRSWADPLNLGRSTNIQLLDEPGKAENAELQR